MDVIATTREPTREDPTVVLTRDVLVIADGKTAVLRKGTPVALLTDITPGVKYVSITSIYGPECHERVEVKAINARDVSLGTTTRDYRMGRRAGAQHMAAEVAAYARLVASLRGANTLSDQRQLVDDIIAITDGLYAAGCAPEVLAAITDHGDPAVIAEDAESRRRAAVTRASADRRIRGI